MLTGIQQVRNEALELLYEELKKTPAEDEAHDRLVRAIATIEDANAKDYQTEMRGYEADVQAKIDSDKIEAEAKLEKSKRRSEIAKMIVDIVLKGGAGFIVMTAISWILKQEQTGAVTSKAFSICTSMLGKMIRI